MFNKKQKSKFLTLSILFFFSLPLIASIIHKDLISKSQELYKELYKAGHIQSTIHFHYNTDPTYIKSLAYVDYNVETKVCNVFIDRKGMQEEGLTSELQFRFIMYHEMAHCHLYDHPKDHVVFPELSKKANQLISDWVKLSFFELPSDLEEPRINGYSSYHETYADIKAIALLVSQGIKPEALRFVSKIRKSAFKSLTKDPHNTFGVLADIFAINWNNIKNKNIDNQVRQLSDQYLVESYFMSNYRINTFTPDLIMSALHTNVSLPAFNFYYDSHTKREAKLIEESFYTAYHIADQPISLLAKLAKEKLSENEVIEAYFSQRYKIGIYKMNSVYHEIAEKFLNLNVED